MEYYYKLQPLELSEYTCLYPEFTNLDVKIYIDECSSYKRWNHPLWLIASKGDPYVDTWVAISVSEEPQIIFDKRNEEYQISDKDITECLEFIRKFNHVLKDIAIEKVDSDAIFEALDLCKNWKICSKLEIERLYNEIKLEFLLGGTEESTQKLS